MSWVRQNLGKIVMGVGSVLSVGLPPVGLAVGAAGAAIDNKVSNPTTKVYPKTQKLIDRIKRSPDYIASLSQAEISEPISPGQDPGGIVPAGFNPLYLFAGALLLIVLLFKK